jgi:hypothetical protein
LLEHEREREVESTVREYVKVKTPGQSGRHFIGAGGGVRRTKALLESSQASVARLSVTSRVKVKTVAWFETGTMGF